MANEQNLKPLKKGDPAPPGAGRPKGSKSLSTIIRQLGENPPDWDKIRLKNKSEFIEQYGNQSAWKAVVYVALSQAMAGDQQAREFLAKRGYGDKLTLEGGEKPLPILATLNVSTDSSTEQSSGDEQTDTDNPGRDGGGEDDSNSPLPDKPSPDKE